MIHTCRKNKEKVYEAIRTGKIEAAEMSFPNLIDDIPYHEQTGADNASGARSAGQTQG